ncbi:hypothetical protein BH10PSE11_BH10PSE11_14190 [soil metagenome]
MIRSENRFPLFGIMPQGTSAPLRRFPFMTVKLTIAAGCALALMPAVTLAQAPPAPAAPQAQTAPPNPARAATNCTPTEVVPQDGTLAPRGATTGRAPESLGDRLAKSDGVLCPPSGVDPEMHAPTPQGGPMPVIPPPGSPGGDPSVRPK